MPHRINIIGEPIEYNGYHMLPIAGDLSITFTQHLIPDKYNCKVRESRMIAEVLVDVSLV